MPKGKPFKKSNEAWWQALPLSPTDKLQIRHLWLTIHHLNDLLDETEAQIAQQSGQAALGETMTFLLQLPGIGLYTGMTILAAIGDITRFPTARHFSWLCGLGAGRLRADIPGKVVHHKQVEQPVVVYIQPRTAHGPERAVLVCPVCRARLSP